jgi:rhamnulokinase
LIEAASATPAPKRLIDVTDRALQAPTNMRDAIGAQLRKHGARPPTNLPGYVRLICDSLGKSHADSVRLLSNLAGRPFNRLLIVGGGSKNALLCQATADAAGLPVVSYELEGSAVGNIASQLIALRAVKSLREFRGHLARQLRGTVYHPKQHR